MDMYQKRKQRKEKREQNIEENKSCASTNINWYPGHMVKAANDIKASLKLIDIVVEILDSRIPLSSRNHIIDDFSEGKAKIIVLNKVDISDMTETNKWKKYFEEQGSTVVLCNANNNDHIKKLLDAIRKVGASLNKYQNKSVAIKPIYRVLIAGIPNVGKSTIINKISNKNSLKVGNKPGVTVRKQWMRLGDDIELLDTPGLLWPRLEDDSGVKLALTGNIKQEILDIENLANEGIKILMKNTKYLDLIKEKYKLSDEDMTLESYEILEVLGTKRGCLVKGGEVDFEKVSKIFLDELKNGKIGNISLDIVE